ncbi:MAG: hypothetical protein ACP5GL_02215 [Infirmifilum sp.]
MTSMGLGEYLECCAKQIGNKSFSLEGILDCARLHWDSIAGIFTSLYGSKRAEEIYSVLNQGLKLGEVEESHEVFKVVSELLEVFLGSLDMTLASPILVSNLEMILNILVEKGIMPEDRRRLWERILLEVKLRLEKNVLWVEGGSATPLIALSDEDLPWALGYLWPYFLDQVEGKGVQGVLKEVQSSIYEGIAVRLKGTPGSGKLALTYLTLKHLITEGYLVYAGDPNYAQLLSGDKVVFSPRGYYLSPAGNKGDIKEIDVSGRLTLEELKEIALRIGAWDGVKISESMLGALVEHSGGNPGFVEAALLHLALCEMSQRRCEVPDSMEKLKAKLRADLPPALVEKLTNLSLISARCFPTGLLEVGEDEEDFFNRVFLKYDPLGLYSWRSLVSREAFSRKIAFPYNPYEVVFSSESPFHSAWSLLSSSPRIGSYVAAKALSELYEEQSYPLLEAVVTLSPGTVARLLRSSTVYRLRVLVGVAEKMGSLALAEELLSLSTNILKSMGGEVLAEELEALTVELAEIQAKRLLPELALRTLSGFSPRDESLRLRSEWIRGASLLNLSEYERAFTHLQEAVRLSQEGNLRRETYSIRILIVDALLGMGRRDEAVKEIESIVKELVRAECTLVDLLFEAAIREKQLKGKNNYAVCASLTRCGYPDLAGSYGCFS